MGEPTVDRKVSVEVAIVAPTERVWPLLTDIELPAGFSEEFQGAHWLASEGPALGAVFEGTNHHPAAGTWTTQSTITAYEVGEIFEWTVGDVANMTARWRFDLEPSQAGSLLRFRAEMGPGPSGLDGPIAAMPDREEEIVGRRLGSWEQNMTATVQGIKALAER